MVQGFVFTPSAALVRVPAITYTVVNTGRCTTTDTRRVTVGLPPTVGADTVLCPGSARPFTLRGSPAGGVFSGPGVSGSVATGFVFTSPVAFTGAVSLTYIVNGGTGYAGATTQRVALDAAPGLAAWAPVDCPETRLAPLTLRFTLTGAGGAPAPGLVWEFGDGTTSMEISPAHTYATADAYQPRLRFRQGGCETLLPLPLVEVVEWKIPNIITPNGDSQNQTFRLGPDFVPRLQMFSRWGQRVFDAPAHRNDWSAEGQPDGMYYYLLTYPDKHRMKGWVEVVH